MKPIILKRLKEKGMGNFQRGAIIKFMRENPYAGTGKMTVRELGERSGLHYSVCSRAENARKYKVTIRHLELVAKATGYLE